MSNEQFITVELNLPNHANELSKAEEVIDKLKERFKSIQTSNSITDKKHDELFEQTIRILDYVGKLSIPLFDVSGEIEEAYCKKYIHAPQLAKQLWLEHYEYIHHPYNLLKNRCFRLLEELDEEYQKKFNKFPPNWKP